MGNTQHVVIPVTGGELIERSEHRTGLRIFNVSGSLIVYLGTHPGVIATDGYLILPNAELHLSKGLGDNPELQWFAISPSGAGLVCILESFDLPAIKKGAVANAEE